jgi:DNA modification methylase
MAADEGVRMPSEIRMFEVEALLPYARNSRKHSPAQIEALAGTIQRVGWTTPILVADGGILAGHGRIMAAKKLGLSRVPGIDLSHLAEDERRALVISDNRLAEMATWDLEMLKLETDDLRAAGFDLELYTGFAEEDLAKLFEGMVDPEPPGGGDPDAVPDVPVVPHSRLGDVWEIAGHRVMCGSSLEPKDWDTLMAGEQADVVWTDPPYNVDIGERNKSLDRADGGNRAKSGSILNDKMGDEEFYSFLFGMYRCVFDVMKPGAPIYVAHPECEAINFRTAFKNAEFKQQGAVIWNKNQFTLGRMDHQQRTETILYGWKPGAAHKWYGGRKVNNVIDLGDENPFQKTDDGRWVVKVGDRALVIRGDVEIEVMATSIIHEPKPARSESHPTMKPVALVARQLRNSSRPGDIVVDAFGGSGTTGVAAHQVGARSRLMELDPKYVDVIVHRLEMFTGRRAVHAVTGEPFPRDGETRRAPEPAAVAEPDDGEPF